MRTLVLLLILAAFVPLPHGAIAHQAKAPAPAEGCEGAPAHAVLTLPAPASHWMRIVCTDTGHTVAPIAGDAWQIIHDQRPFTIAAAADGSGTPGRHSSYFVSARVERLNKANGAVARARFASKADFALPETARAIYAVYFLSSTGRRDTIYVFLDGDEPVAGLACLGSCATTVVATVTHAEEEPPPQ
jgi:hypothetical protein